MTVLHLFMHSPANFGTDEGPAYNIELAIGFLP